MPGEMWAHHRKSTSNSSCPKSSEAAPSRTVGKRILVATAQPAINQVVGEILSSAGFEVKTTTHPSEVIALVTDFEPQVAFVGLIVPEIDGIKLSEQLAPRFPHLRIVLTGEDVEDGILRHLLERGVTCDTLEPPFERKELLEMTAVWASGSDYIDRTTLLRDSYHFQLALPRHVGNPEWRTRNPSIIFVELFCPARSGDAQFVENSFLHQLGELLARFAENGFAYRYGVNEFALFLTRTAKRDACELALRLSAEIRSLFDVHDLTGTCFPAIGLVSIPQDVESVERVVTAKSRLLAAAKARPAGGVEVYGFGAIILR
jgi:PleD family two-component response regulator